MPSTKAEIQAAERENRIRAVPYDPMMNVDLFWDLGFADRVSIWSSATDSVRGSHPALLRGRSSGHRLLPARSTDLGLYDWNLLPAVGWWHAQPGDRQRHRGIDADGRGFKTLVNKAAKAWPMASTPCACCSTQLYFDAANCADGLQYLRRYQVGTANEGRQKASSRYRGASRCMMMPHTPPTRSERWQSRHQGTGTPAQREATRQPVYYNGRGDAWMA